MTVPATLSILEAQVFQALGDFITQILPSGVQVSRGQLNRVAEPAPVDFVLMTQIGQERLATNYEVDYDNIFAASITGSIMTVTDLIQTEGPLQDGMLLIDGTVGEIVPNTTIVNQLSGSLGGTGVYTVAPPQSLASETLYAGQQSHEVPTIFDIQCDVHGPASSNNSLIVTSLFWSEVAVDSFAALGLSMAPLYCTDPHEAPFRNDQQQIEYRWSFDARIQINPVTSVPIQFADELTPTVVEADQPGLA
jgi:hypothetical protein